MHDKPRRKGFRQSSIIMSGGSDEILGYNVKRCALLLSCSPQPSKVNCSLDGTPASGNNSIVLNTNSAPLYLPEEVVADVITGPIYVNGTATQSVTAVEWFYLD